MRNLLTGLILLAFRHVAFTQTNLDEITFIQNLIRETQPEGQIIYADKISKNDFKKIKSKINFTYITGTSNDTRQNSIQLTRQEKKILSSELDKCYRTMWNDNLFPNSKIIKGDDAINYIKSSYMEYLEKYNNPNNTEEDRMTLVKSYQRPTVFKFTKPVLIRENTLFILYLSSICGSPCGFEEVSIYKKENTGWKKWIVVDHVEH